MNNQLWQRYALGTTWQAWQRQAVPGDLDSYLLKTGGTITGNLAINGNTTLGSSNSSNTYLHGNMSCYDINGQNPLQIIENDTYAWIGNIANAAAGILRQTGNRSWQKINGTEGDFVKGNGSLRGTEDTKWDLNIRSQNGAFDINNLTTAGNFLVEQTAGTNHPFPGNYFHLINLVNWNGNTRAQIAIADNQNLMSFRRYYNGSWQPWEPIITSSIRRWSELNVDFSSSFNFTLNSTKLRYNKEIRLATLHLDFKNNVAIGKGNIFLTVPEEVAPGITGIANSIIPTAVLASNEKIAAIHLFARDMIADSDMPVGQWQGQIIWDTKLSV
jgi:hypothetical protein